MANLTVKGVPEPLVAELKKQAAAHRRSLNGEVLYRLERSLASGSEDTRRFLREVDRLRNEIGIHTTAEEIIAARDEGRR